MSDTVNSPEINGVISSVIRASASVKLSAHYSEIFTSEEDSADKWYAGRLAFITVDEVIGKEKRTYTNVLVQAADIHDAMKKLDEGMKGTMADYSSISLKETAIVDVYPYHVEDKEQQKHD